MSSVAELRKQRDALREKNRATAEAQKEAREEERLKDEIACEQAREAAYAKYGADHVLGGEIQGAGFVLLHWPDPVDWRHFVNQGILKKDKLTDEMCHALVHKCRVYPDIEPFKTRLARNPNAAVILAGKIIDAMTPGEEDEGKE